MLKVRPKERPTTDELLKHPTIKKKCGFHIDESDYAVYDNNKNDPLLQTIKFNHRNMNSIKTNLPKSSYGDEKKEKSR